MPRKVDKEPTLEERIKNLTPRQIQAWASTVWGLTNEETADRMGVDVKTVEKHKKNLYERLGVKTNVEAATLLSTFLIPLLAERRTQERVGVDAAYNRLNQLLMAIFREPHVLFEENLTIMQELYLHHHSPRSSSE